MERSPHKWKLIRLLGALVVSPLVAVAVTPSKLHASILLRQPNFEITGELEPLAASQLDRTSSATESDSSTPTDHQSPRGIDWLTAGLEPMSTAGDASGASSAGTGVGQAVLARFSVPRPAQLTQFLAERDASLPDPPSTKLFRPPRAV